VLVLRFEGHTDAVRWYCIEADMFCCCAREADVSFAAAAH
jgi:hypothetical protein